ncbi:MAG TPA: outer membrane beta-barrel protein [Pyrinomonadaceae bacterium]|nr:outer membrane beta-barrel protein [Pyrinomonadaceae bacterium]
MTKPVFAFVLVILVCASALAQNSTDHKKYEFFAGYSNGQSDDGHTFNGVNVAGVYYIRRYLGIKADFSGTYRNSHESYQISTGGIGQTFTHDNRSSIYNVLGGVQIKDSASKARFKPFAHVLAGLGHRRFEAKNVTCTPGPVPCFGAHSIQTGFAAAFGGGLDIRINDKIDFRAFQIDYNPMVFNGRTDHNARFGIGFVFK